MRTRLTGVVLIAVWHYLVTRGDTADLTARYLRVMIELYDPRFGLIRELDRFTKFPNRTIYERVPEPYVSGIEFIFRGNASRDRIYVGNSDRGYEILVFDLDGRIIRKIRRAFTPVPVSEGYKKDYLEKYLDFMPTGSTPYRKSQAASNSLSSTG